MREIAKESEVVIFWGKTPDLSSLDMLDSLKSKKIIVIDPLKTDIAKISDLHISIEPNGDFFLAMLLCRFLYIYDCVDEEYLIEQTDGFEDFYELTQSIRIVNTLKEIGVDLSEIESVIELVATKRVSIISGKGLEKSEDRDDILSAIEAFEVMLGLFRDESFNTPSGKFEFLQDHDCALASNLEF